MTYTATTYLEAAMLAQRLRAIYARDGWRVIIVRPRFAGDRYHVNVG